MRPLPPPLAIPWTMKPLESAETRIEVLDDGRLHLWISHDLLEGVTPEMLVWWFRNLEGEMDLEGQRVPRYRVWHPRDHVAFEYARRTDPIGPGSVFHIVEVLARDPAWGIDVLSPVVRLDEGGFAHRPRVHGLSLARMDYAFERVPGGTRYVNSLTFGIEGRPGLVRPLNQALRHMAFPEAKGRAWLLHNVEEVGNFQFFLPMLHASKTGGRVPHRGGAPLEARSAKGAFAWT